MWMFQHRDKILKKFKLLLLSKAKTAILSRGKDNCCEISGVDDGVDVRVQMNPEQDDHEWLLLVKEQVKWSKRLVFEPAGSTRSILEAAKVPFRLDDTPVVVVALDTKDPQLDFRVSMEEMVDAFELDGSEQLGELLAWYLRMNRNEYHCYILEAFVEMIMASSFLIRPACSCSY
ncbi:Transcription repressor OFP13 [Linum perenne]